MSSTWLGGLTIVAEGKRHVLRDGRREDENQAKGKPFIKPSDLVRLTHYHKNSMGEGRALWLIACNSSTLGGWGRWITRSRDLDHPGQHGETVSLLKIENISQAWWYSGGWGRRIAWTMEAEVAVIWDYATALQPGWQSETLSQK